MGVNETILHMPGGVDLMKINKNSIQAVVEKNTFVEINLTVSSRVKDLERLNQELLCLLDVGGDEQCTVHGDVDNKFREHRFLINHRND